jgi:hypothetical protein
VISAGSNGANDRIHGVEDQPVIVTAAINADDLRPYETLRQQYFPRERNFIPAHLTMFHALPGAFAPQVTASLDRASGTCNAIVLDVVGVKLLSAGVAFVLESDDLRQMRERLRQQFQPWLTRQDAQRWKPHITIQNKVAPAAARCIHADLLAGFQHDRLRMHGLDAWRYMGGPWRSLASFRFDHPSSQA